jgi:hypothetical protein
MADGAAAEGVALFNAGRWWEAHEAWEAAWRAARGAERSRWQGLILAAAALLHRERGNAHGVAAQGDRALARLAGDAPPGFPIETAAFRLALERCLRDDAPAPRAALAGGAAHLPRTDRP